MIRLVLLSVVAAGLMCEAYTSLITGEFGLSDPTKSRTPSNHQDTPWTEIDLAAQSSPHAVVPDQGLKASVSPIEVENATSTASSQATSATEQADYKR